MLSLDDTLTPFEIEAALQQTAQQSIFATPDAQQHDDDYGFGAMRPAEAIALVMPRPAEGEGEGELISPSESCASTSSVRGFVGLLVALLWTRRRR